MCDVVVVDVLVSVLYVTMYVYVPSVEVFSVYVYVLDEDVVVSDVIVLGKLVSVYVPTWVPIVEYVSADVKLVEPT